MKISSKQISVGFFAALALVTLAILFTHPGATARSHLAAGIAPFIVQDTQLDPSETNLATGIVTFSAEIGGMPAPALQWKVDKGNGFERVSGATNPACRIADTQVVPNGFYALFATNSAGSVHTTPQRLFVEEGED